MAVRKRKKNYFGKDVEMSVAKFLTTEDYETKMEIFDKELQYPLQKLIENIVATYKFHNLGDSFQSVQDDCLSFLYLNMHKFKPDKGRAYSYFGTIVKNYCIQMSMKQKKNNKIYVIDDQSENFAEQFGLIVDEEDTFTVELFSYLVEKFDIYMVELDNINDKKVLHAIIYLLENYKVIDLRNKKQLYVLLREITGFQTKQITGSLLKIKEKYVELKNDFVNCNY